MCYAFYALFILVLSERPCEMNTPDYPSLSAKLMRHSQELCNKCELTVLRGQGQSKPCQADCPSQALLQSAKSILENMSQP